MKIVSSTILLIVIAVGLPAQEKWDLKRCIEYAHKNNLDVVQNKKRAAITGADWETAKAEQYPLVNGFLNNGFEAGRFVNPTTNDFVPQKTTTYTSSLGLQGSVDLFNWFRKKNITASKNYEYQAAQMQTEQVKNLLTLDIAAAYLQILLAKEQLKLNEAQIKLTQAQLTNTQQRVRAGLLPELNLVQLKGQLIKDSAGYNEAYIITEQSFFLLKQLMNMPMTTAMEVEPFALNSMQGNQVADISPEIIYQMAIGKNPVVRVAELKIQSLQAGYKAVRAQAYPSVSLVTGLQSVALLNPQKTEGTGNIITIVDDIPVGKAFVNNVAYDVYPLKSFYEGYERLSIGKQFENNFRQNIGVAVNVPIFNGQATRINIGKSKMLVEEQVVQKEKEQLALKKSIYLAYYDSKRAYQKFIAARKAVDVYQQAYNFSMDRYKMGVLGTVELLIIQNDFFKAKVDAISAQYDYFFKVKVLEFYKTNSFDL